MEKTSRRGVLAAILGMAGCGVAVADPVSRLVGQPETFQLNGSDAVFTNKREGVAFLNKWIEDNPSLRDLAKGIEGNIVVYDADFPGKFSIKLMENLIHASKGFRDKLDYILLEKQACDNKYKYYCDYDLKEGFSFCGVPIKETVLELSAIAKSMGLEHPSHFEKRFQFTFPINGNAVEDVILHGNSKIWRPVNQPYTYSSGPIKEVMTKVSNQNVVLAVSMRGRVLLGSF